MSFMQTNPLKIMAFLVNCIAIVIVASFVTVNEAHAQTCNVGVTGGNQFVDCRVCGTTSLYCCGNSANRQCTCDASSCSCTVTGANCVSSGTPTTNCMCSASAALCGTVSTSCAPAIDIYGFNQNTCVCTTSTGTTACQLQQHTTTLYCGWTGGPTTVPPVPITHCINELPMPIVR